MKKYILKLLIAYSGMCLSLNAQNTLTGTITASNKNSFTIRAEQVNLLPSKTDTCKISKDISGTKNPFGITVKSGWLGVADALFLSSKGNELTFKITKETSEIVVNGKKQNHFEKGKILKVVWK